MFLTMDDTDTVLAIEAAGEVGGTTSFLSVIGEATDFLLDVLVLLRELLLPILICFIFLCI